MKILLANTVDPDQMPHNVASDLGLHCLPITLIQVSRQEWIKGKNLLQEWTPNKREEKKKKAELFLQTM